MRRASHAGLVFTGHRRIVHRTILLRVAWRSLHRVDVGLRVLDRLIVWFSRLRTWNVYGFFWHEDGTDGTAIGSKEKPRAYAEHRRRIRSTRGILALYRRDPSELRG